MQSKNKTAFLAKILGTRRAEEFVLFLGRLFWLPPVDRKQIFLDIARRSSGNVRFRMGKILFPDEREKRLAEAKKLPPVWKQIENHFDPKTGAARK
ncbi:MAG: hypothetical protein ACR2P4_02645 [Gammaproteobacteria bacterium]